MHLNLSKGGVLKGGQMKKFIVITFLSVVLCQSILFSKADPNNNTKSQIAIDAQLLQAVENADPNSIKQALAEGANPNWVSDTLRKYSMIDRLLMTIYESDKAPRCLQCLNLLFDAGAKLQWCDNEILFFPIASGFPEVVELLIKKGANPTSIIEGMTPIEWAESEGHQDVVEVLLKYGAKPISKEQAAQNRFVQLARESYKNKEYFEQRNVVDMEIALKDGATINGKNSKGDIALVIAINCAYNIEQYITVVYLLQKGANPNLKSERQEFEELAGIPLHHAVAFHGLMVKEDEDRTIYQRLIIKALLDAGAHVSSRGYKGMTPVHIAAKNNDTYMANVLIKAGAKIMDRDDLGKTPLDYAESADMVKLLKSAGAKEL